MNQKYSCGKVIRYIGFVLFSVGLVGLCQGQQEPSLDQLVDQFQSTEVFVRQLEIAQRIITFQDRSILPKLERWLNHEDRHLRGNAALIFTSLGDDRGFRIIQDILNDHAYRPEGQGMGLVPGDGKYRAELQIRADRFYATHLFGVLKDPRAVPILVDVLGDPGVTYKALWSLGEIGDKQALGAMTSMLDDGDPSIRVHAIYALVQLRAKEALPKLHELLGDNERSRVGDSVTVGEAAKAAISQLEQQP